MAVLNGNVDFVSMLIGTDTRRLLRENGAGETPQERSDEEPPRTAHGKRSAFRCNQQPGLTQPKEYISAFHFLNKACHEHSSICIHIRDMVDTGGSIYGICTRSFTEKNSNSAT